MTENYGEAMRRLIEFGQAAAQLAQVGSDRDERVYEAHKAGISKAEIARVTGLSWATVDRTVRDMQTKEVTTDDHQASNPGQGS